MNKRKKKKAQKKEQLFMDFFTSSYREYKKTNRSYHEYNIEHKHATKRCIGCIHSIKENGVHTACELFFRFEACNYQPKGE